MQLKIRKLSNALGAEIVDFQVSDTLSESVVEQLRSAFLKYQILLFRNQPISFETHIAFSRYFGKLETHDSVPDYRHDQYPELLHVTNEGRERSNVFGRQWHTDHSMTINPAMASLLHAHQLPDVGGDTMFSNMYLAYDTLSPGLRKTLDGLDAVHTVAAARHLRGIDPDLLKKKVGINPPVVHPVVRIHPETQRPALYVNEMLTSHFSGWTPDESASLLRYLFDHSTQHEFVYRHQWRKHDLIMWDNRCTMHLALADYDHQQARHLYRTTLTGTQTGHYANA